MTPVEPSPAGRPSDLERIGWDASWQAAFGVPDDPTLFAARAFGDRRGTFTVSDGVTQWQGRVAGRLRHRAATPADLPVVGDWLVCRVDGGTGAPGANDVNDMNDMNDINNDVCTIHAVLPRRTKIVRKVAGERQDEQVMAANVDTVVILMGLDGDLNQRRLDRYVALARSGGARPIVLLTKADLARDTAADVARIRALTSVIPVAPVCLLGGDLPEVLAAELQLARTLVLVGSSGVGKSTLINRLVGKDVQRTGAVRASDNRGRHTTTYRQMFAVAGGALVIDTPGLREIQLMDADVGVAETFPDITSLEAGCRFRDCLHDFPTGCAVMGAVADGRLAQARLASFHRLRLSRTVGARPARRGGRSRPQ